MNKRCVFQRARNALGPARPFHGAAPAALGFPPRVLGELVGDRRGLFNLIGRQAAPTKPSERAG